MYHHSIFLLYEEPIAVPCCDVAEEASINLVSAQSRSSLVVGLVG